MFVKKVEKASSNEYDTKLRRQMVQFVGLDLANGCVEAGETLQSGRVQMQLVENMGNPREAMGGTSTPLTAAPAREPRSPSLITVPPNRSRLAL